jgi:hypothetical protein
LRFEHGYWDVEYASRKFRLYLTNLNPGMEYLLEPNSWVDEQHPLIAPLLSAIRTSR